MSSFVIAMIGGLVGGVTAGLIAGLALLLFGRRILEGLLDRQVALLEARLKQNVLDVALGRLAAFLDQSERIGQIVRRVVEIAQLLLQRGPPSSAAPPADGAGAAGQGLRDLAAAARDAAIK